MGELRSALDALAGTDLDGMSDGELLAHVSELVVAGNRVAAALTRAVRRADVRGASEFDGAKTMQAWLRGVPRVSGSAASRLVSQGRRLEQLPAADAAFAAGAIGADQVEVLAELATPKHLDLAREQGIDVAAVETVLVQLACAGTHRDLQKAVGDYLAKLDPDGPEPDPTDERQVTLVQHPDGSWTIGGSLDPVGGQKRNTIPSPRLASSPRAPGDGRPAHR